MAQTPMWKKKYERVEDYDPLIIDVDNVSDAISALEEAYSNRAFDDDTSMCPEWICSAKFPNLTVEDIVYIYAYIYSEYEHDRVVRYNLDENYIEDLAEREEDF